MTRTCASCGIISAVVMLSTAAPSVCIAGECVPEQVDKLTASNADTLDRFGIAVSISGTRAAVGAYLDEGAGTNSGSAYVFAEAAPGVWVEEDMLVPDDGAAGDWFGVWVSIDGDTALVGAQWHDAQGTDSGAAYVFDRRTDGSWSQSDKLVPAESGPSDWCGHSVALDGDTAVVSAQLDDDNGTNAGAAYVFVRDGDGRWTEQAKLTASDGAAGDEFGTSVAVDGDVIVIGGRWADVPGAGGDAGAAWVFRRTGGNWNEEAKLTADDAEAGDEFGFSVAVEGDHIIVGSRLEDEAGAAAGAAYAFVRTGAGEWVQEAKLTGSDAAAEDRSGESVSISGDRAVVGARLRDAAGADSGAAYVFQRSADGSWSEAGTLASDDLAPMDFFGIAVAIDGPRAIAGANLDDDDGDQSGSAYVFDLGAGATPGDFDCSGAVDVADLLALLAAWGPCREPCAFDLDASGTVDVADLLTLLSNWG